MDNDGSYTYSPEVEVKTELLQLYALYQNFPNPFNPGTKIEYFLPDESEVKLIISNTAGETIAELVNMRQSAGYFTETFNPAGLTSGVYFCKLNASSVDGKKNISIVRKMLFLK
ncbi:MAG: T9SS type A sorting domain-containing protein [Ignavibacteriales bacterium]|nr:T9SS type A sorting domain-containing protein [Ignavibacteriales bacterium]